MLLRRSLITRTSLQDVGQLLLFIEAKDYDAFRDYSTTCDPASLVLLDNINEVWTSRSKIKLLPYEIETSKIKIKDGSLLHRWIVFDAVESASSVPQESEGADAIGAARAWILNPSEKNRVMAYDAADIANTVHAVSYAATRATYAAAGAAYATADSRFAGYSTTGAAYDARLSYLSGVSSFVANADTYSIVYTAVSFSCKLRIRVLATLAKYLPEPL